MKTHARIFTGQNARNEQAAKGSLANFPKAISTLPAGEVVEGDEIPTGYKRRTMF
jgi:hypothetical protein